MPDVAALIDAARHGALTLTQAPHNRSLRLAGSTVAHRDDGQLNPDHHHTGEPGSRSVTRRATAHPTGRRLRQPRADRQPVKGAAALSDVNLRPNGDR